MRPSILALALVALPCLGQLPANYTASKVIELNDNGAWSWFMDERAIVHNNTLVVGSVRAVKGFDSGKSDPNWGNVEIATLDIATGKAGKTILHAHYEQDDHNGPAFLPLADGRILAIYTKHGTDRKVYWSISEANDPLKWSEPKVFESPGADAPAFRGNNVTYSNPFHFPGGKIYNFYRGFDLDPNYMISEDDARSWKYGGHFLKGRDGYSPYLKYAYDGKGTLHFIATEDHPRNFDNSIYHGFFRDGKLHHSDGTLLGPVSTSTEVKFRTWDLTRVFQGDADNVGWVIDCELDSENRPYIAFSVQKDGRGLPPRQGGFDHRYHYGRWDGQKWNVHEIAYAGVRLYPFEDDYTGLVALHPHDPNVLFISTNADPKTGSPLVSSADQKRHYEIFRGETKDGGKSWTWTAITANSTMDNLRPLCPKWNEGEGRTALVWMRGTYTHNHGEWTTAVVATILDAQKR